MTNIEKARELSDKIGRLAGRNVLMKELNISESEARNIAFQLKLEKSQDEESMTDEEIIAENVRLAKQKQKYQDKNRISNKSFREYARVENAVSALNEELIKLLRENSFKSFNGKKEKVKGTEYGIVQFSDWHINELVNLQHNTYDINIANKRIKKYISSTIKRFLDDGVAHVLVACTGDMINSDRRLDEKLHMATNRTRAQFLAVELLYQSIEELSIYFNVKVASICGNESRVNKDWEWSDACVTDNYDYAIHNILEILLENNDRVEFCGDAKIKSVVNFGGKNILLIHGVNFGKDPHNGITKIIRQYAQKGVIIDFVLFGHIHESYISELFGRSCSPVGANDYSEEGLLLHSSASQNRYRVFEHSIDGEVVNLQNVDGIEGYDISEKLMKYNPKSADKNKSEVTVFKVVV